MDQFSTTEPLISQRQAAPPFNPDYVNEASERRRALSKPLSLITGTGYSVYNGAIVPAIKAARQEVILVTCFWAPSVTRDAINLALRELSATAIASSRKVSVHICFSSSSLARNMLLPTPKKGQTYPPETWSSLGLPSSRELQGLNLRVTRKFFWPWGIIHSKYLIIDRKLAIFPSCNVSWERWFEVAISIQGPVVHYLSAFHSQFWDGKRSPSRATEGAEHTNSEEDALLDASDSTSSRPVALSGDAAFTTLLPSPHNGNLLPNHLNPRGVIEKCPCVADMPLDISQTPLLLTTYHLLSTATSTITMFTPNFTEPAVLEALTKALKRGVDVVLWTNRNLMTVEQLVTAGTTTPRYVRLLERRSETLRGSFKAIFFDERAPGEQQVRPADKETTPVKLHAKVTIVDGVRILFGSGNMDAASWSTSQELGVLVESREVVDEFVKQWSFGQLEA